jgi:hypothetical protein
VGVPKLSFGKGKEGPWLGNDARAGLDARVTYTLAGAVGGGGDQGRRTPHRPDASSTGRKPSLTSKPRLAGGTPASAAWGGTEREKEGGPLPCERERACAGVHEYANGVYGARVRTPTPRPLTAVRTVVAAR